MQRYMVYDFETRSKVDLKKSGSWIYSRDPSTEILCVAWAIGTKEELRSARVRSWSPFILARELNFEMPQIEFFNALMTPDMILVCHNAAFEQAITQNTFDSIMDLYPKHRKHLYPERWMCTASMAAALALPRSLDGACQALGLKHQKDKDGHRLMLKMSKPGKKGWHNSLSDLKRLVQYCEQDIRAEIDLFLAIPPLSKDERKIWVLDQKINQRGFRIDRPLVDSALKLIAEEVENLRQETNDLSNGAFESTNRRAQVLQWLEAQGTYLPDLTAKTVRDAISTGAVEGKSKRMLEIRQSVSKTSTAKFEAFRARADEHGYVRDNLLYHGASTGRWSGSGVQVQNFPKGSLKHEDIEIAVDAIKSGDLDWVRTLYGDPMRTFSNCLRGVIIPTEGREFFCADYASIELRMLFWFAGHEMGMKVLREGRDLYSELAAILYRKPVEEIEKGSKERFVAKSAILGCGYQLGGEKFQASCLLQGVEIDREMADLAVKTYRTTHYPVPQFWYNTERAAAAAVQSPGKKFRINKTTWFVKDEFLWAELPSGRRLAYYQPCIKTKKTSWGEDKAMLHHMGINPKTRKWELSGTYGGRLVENLVQAASRDLMAEAMLRLEDAGYQVVLSVHDEALAEILPGKGSLKEFERLMSQVPEWAKGAPISTSGWQGFRYRK